MADNEETIEDIEETAEEEESLEGGPKRKLLGPAMVKTLLYVAAALVLIIVSGTIAYIVAKKVGRAPATEKTAEEYREKPKPLAYFSLDPFSINTSDVDEPHFVKITINLGYEAGKTDLQTELNARRAQLRDIIISIIGSKKYSDLNTQDKREKLKQEIMNKINDVLRTGQIKAVFIVEFVLT